MSDERWFKDRQTTVTVGLTDGRTLVGTLGRFRPGDADLVLTLRSRGAAGLVATQHQRLAAEHIAYVAVHRGGILPASGAFGEIYFYAHSVNAREEKTTLADILVETGALAPDGGMRTLVPDGIEKCLAGHTDLGRVVAVCSR
ncbi:MAG: hypothetical protein ABSH53_07140 [Holophaga sp.]|jgi:hypothetical protein